MKGKFLGTMVLIFLIVAGICYGLNMQQPAFDLTTLLVADALMLVFTLIAWMITQKTLLDRPQAFVRGVISGTMIKMFAVLAAVVAYAMMNKGHLYKPMVLAFFGIYVIYTAAETVLTSKMAKGVK